MNRYEAVGSHGNLSACVDQGVREVEIGYQNPGSIDLDLRHIASNIQVCRLELTLGV